MQPACRIPTMHIVLSYFLIYLDLTPPTKNWALSMTICQFLNWFTLELYFFLFPDIPDNIWQFLIISLKFEFFSKKNCEYFKFCMHPSVSISPKLVEHQMSVLHCWHGANCYSCLPYPLVFHKSDTWLIICSWINSISWII